MLSVCYLVLYSILVFSCVILVVFFLIVLSTNARGQHWKGFSVLFSFVSYAEAAEAEATASLALRYYL